MTNDRPTTRKILLILLFGVLLAFNALVIVANWPTPQWLSIVAVAACAYTLGWAVWSDL
jgi:uncharacterized membrane protein YqjE